jgi:hypothetical protein
MTLQSSAHTPTVQIKHFARDQTLASTRKVSNNSSSTSSKYVTNFLTDSPAPFGGGADQLPAAGVHGDRPRRVGCLLAHDDPHLRKHKQASSHKLSARSDLPSLSPRGKQSPLTRGSEARAEAPASNSRRSTSGGDDAVASRPNATRRRLTPGGPSSSRRRIHAAQVTFPTAPSPPFPAIGHQRRWCPCGRRPQWGPAALLCFLLALGPSREEMRRGRRRPPRREALVGRRSRGAAECATESSAASTRDMLAPAARPRLAQAELTVRHSCTVRIGGALARQPGMARRCLRTASPAERARFMRIRVCCVQLCIAAAGARWRPWAAEEIVGRRARGMKLKPV